MLALRIYNFQPRRASNLISGMQRRSRTMAYEFEALLSQCFLVKSPNLACVSIHSSQAPFSGVFHAVQGHLRLESSAVASPKSYICSLASHNKLECREDNLGFTDVISGMFCSLSVMIFHICYKFSNENLSVYSHELHVSLQSIFTFIPACCF